MTSNSQKVKQEQKRQKVIEEIVLSEARYNASLQQANSMICSDIVNEFQAKSMTRSSFSWYEIDQNNSYITLFKILKDVQTASDVFLQKLNLFLQPGSAFLIYNCFNNFNELIRANFEYIEWFHRSIASYRSQLARSQAFREKVEAAEAKFGDTLESILITPVQRPPRYRLLLQELIKTYPKADDSEASRLKETLDSLCVAISSVDQNIEEFDESVRLNEFQSKCSDFRIADQRGRRFLFEGAGKKFSRKVIEDRYFVLLSDMLLICKNGLINEYRKNKLFPSGDYLISDVPDTDFFKNAIDIRHGEKSFRCNMGTPEAKKGILAAYQKMIEITKIDVKEVEKKGLAPVWVPDDHAPTCMRCHEKFTFFNRRHHCRYCGDCVCKKCLPHSVPLPGRGTKRQKVCALCFEHIWNMDETFSQSNPSDFKADHDSSDSEDH